MAHKVAFEQVKSAAPKLYLLEYYEGQGKSLKEIAEVKSLDYELMRKYNKWLKRGRVPTDKPYAVILPYEDNSGKLIASSKSAKQVKSVSNDRRATGSQYQTHPARYPIIKSYRNRNKGIRVNGIKAVRVKEQNGVAITFQPHGSKR